MTSVTGRRGFTLIELLVVIAVIAVLAAMLLGALGIARSAARKAQARKEVTEIASALGTYFMELHMYPPDTDDWGAKGGYDELANTTPTGRDIDERSIHRYLASEVRVNQRRAGTQQMALKDDRLKDCASDPDQIGIYVDPWGIPFDIDCMHMVYRNGTWQQKGWPYKQDATVDTTTLTADYKVVSYGPDAEGGVEPAYFPFGEREGDVMQDDLRSW